MKVLVAAHRADETGIFEKINEKYQFELDYSVNQLTLENAEMTKGYDAVCINVGCKVSEEMAGRLKEYGVEYILTRAAGRDHLDAEAIQKYGLKSAYVPAYSPNAISEHTVLLMLSLLRKYKEQMRRIQEQYYFINGLRGKELRSITVGVIGTGRIGFTTIKDLSGFGCRILAHDIMENEAVKAYASYVSLEELLETSDMIVLHCPMTAENYHLIDEAAIEKMKDGVMLVNTARGGLVDTQAVLNALKSGKMAAFGMDVYEYEDKTQRKDYRGKELDDPLLAELLQMDQVIFTSHTAFYTDQAIENIVDTTLTNLYQWSTTGSCENETFR